MYFIRIPRPTLLYVINFRPAISLPKAALYTQPAVKQDLARSTTKKFSQTTPRSVRSERSLKVTNKSIPNAQIQKINFALLANLPPRVARERRQAHHHE